MRNSSYVRIILVNKRMQVRLWHTWIEIVELENLKLILILRLENQNNKDSLSKNYLN